MCGIAGILAFKDKSLLNKCTLENMTKVIHHRGPDDEGFYLNEWVGFGFRRLSIIDISFDGHQPMFDLSKNYVIVFNGEIYNYKVLKEELVKKNYKFKSNSDTEVLLNAYIEWGTDCLLKLEGMFAFIIYDKTKDEVIAARDHLGIKPLYYFRKDSFFLFGSEIKSFKNIIKFELNERQLYQQLVYGYVSGKDTIFKDIYRVRPGTFIRFNKKGIINEKLYYDVTANLKEESNINLDYEEIKNDLKESILKHTMSDVGYNAQLSGGIDTSYITAVLSKECKRILNTYSITLQNFKDDESKYQKIVTRSFNTIHHSLPATAIDMRDNFERATWHHDIPIVHTGSVFLMLLSKHSKSNSKVILTGEGSDELFGGYSTFNNIVLNKYKILSYIQRYDKLLNLIPSISKLEILKNSIKNFYLGVDQFSLLYKEKSISLFHELEKCIDYRKSVVQNIKKLENKIFATFQTSCLSYLLERQDKMAMANSVEARVPFCNYILFGKMNKISFEKKLKPTPKTILKILSEQYYDKSFIYRRKNPFVLPINQWLKDEKGLRSWLDFLSDKTFKERGFYNHKNINTIINQHIKGNKDNSKSLMKIIKFEIWHRIFID
jgi:asparagine synthase (glutamine-hydrolysing)